MNPFGVSGRDAILVEPPPVETTGGAPQVTG